MAHVVVVREWLLGAVVGDSVVHSWANRGECGGEVVEGPCEHFTRVSDGDGDEFHPAQYIA